MSQGTIQVITFTLGENLPVANAQVTLSKKYDDGTSFKKSFTTDTDGYSIPIAVAAPDAKYSLDENNTTVMPYSTYDMVVTADGYENFLLNNIQVFDGQNSLIEVALQPQEPADSVTAIRAIPDIDTIPEHHLFAQTGSASGRTPVEACIPDSTYILKTPVIPDNITVHLGKPTSSAQNVTISFRNYIKNVASSEIYPTWPTESLKANIYAQISLALNRVFTEWYASKGYSFQITNSTSYDQYYVHNRNIFENISKIVDEIFNTYIRRPGTIDPYYAEYCDGKIVTNCPGMKQWGTVSLANSGKNALSILKTYYGNNIELITSNNITSIPKSYPGVPLKVGSTGDNVRIIQRQLNRIAQNYPSFGTQEVDGVFGATTEAVVKRFQKQFSLTQDGIVGSSTWYKISFVYVSIKKLAELTSEGEKPTGQPVDGAFAGTTLKVGSRGSAVEQLQFYLNTIGEYVSTIPKLAVDGIFGAGTEAAVKAFQTYDGLTVDGLVGKTTWDAIYKNYSSIEGDVNTDEDYTGQYPGKSFQQGSKGNYVKTIQFWLRIISDFYSAVPKINADGIFGPATTAAVRAFQTYFGLTVDGIVGRATWDKIYEVYTDSTANIVPSEQIPGTYPGTPLQQGSTGSFVKEMQYYLYLISAYYTSIPVIAYDGIFGSATTKAVKAFQTLMNIPSDGIVGPVTWLAIYNTYNKLRTVDGPVFAYSMSSYPGSEIKIGMDGTSVAQVQKMLNYVGLFYSQILESNTDGYFSKITENSVKSFQQEFNLPITGVVDKATWDALVAESQNLFGQNLSRKFVDDGSYPGYVLSLGSQGSAVSALQFYINGIAERFCEDNFLTENGVFGEATQTAVEQFQEGFGLKVTGIVDEETWNTIYEYYNI